MKKYLLASTTLVASAFGAIAADLPARVPAAAPAPVFVANSWTGFYVGVVGGYGSGRNEITPEIPTQYSQVSINSLPVAPTISMNMNGAMIGGRVGYNHQLSNGVVLGVVGDLSWTNISGKSCVEGVLRGSAPACDGSPDDSFAHGKINWFGTVRANLGFAISESLLAYATGGLAVAGTESRITNLYGPGFPDVTDSAVRTGWTIGGGLTYKLSQSWSVGAEYLYADLGRHTYRHTNALMQGTTVDARVSTNLHVVRASLNYHFGSAAAPVVAKY